MKFINEVHISGFVATEPQQSGRGPHHFRLCHGGGKKKDGTEWPRQFFTVTVWDAKLVPQKGARVEIWGKLRQNEYVDKNGNKRGSVELVAESILDGEGPKPTNGTAIAKAILAPAGKEALGDDIPF